MNPQNPGDPTQQSSGNPSATNPPSGWPWPVREPQSSVSVPSRPAASSVPIRDIDEGAFSDPSMSKSTTVAATPAQPIIPSNATASQTTSIPSPAPAPVITQPTTTPPPQAAQTILPPATVPTVPTFTPQDQTPAVAQTAGAQSLSAAPMQPEVAQPQSAASATPVLPAINEPPAVIPTPQVPPVPENPQQLPPQQAPSASPAPQQPHIEVEQRQQPPISPVTLTSPATTPTIQHISPEIAERLGETKNSSEINQMVEKNKRFGHLKGFLSFAVFLAGIFIAALLINQFIFQSYYVEGTSMVPTLKNDDRLIIDKVERSFSHIQGKKYLPERGQIIVLDSSIVGRNGQQEQLIKRVIGLPGDTVHIESGVVTIKNAENPNGFNIDEDLGLALAPTFTQEEIFETTVPEDNVFVMGDNRGENGSYDSRAFGAISLDNIEGRLWARLLPLDQAQIFD